MVVYEDAAGFISNHYVMPRGVQDRDVAVEQSRIMQDRLQKRVEETSFDRGFHSPANQTGLAEIVNDVCLPKPGSKQSVEALAVLGRNIHALGKLIISQQNPNAAAAMSYREAA